MHYTLHHIGITTNDPNHTAAFYAHLLQAEVSTTAGHTVVSTDTIRIAIVPRRPEDPDRYAWGQHLAFLLPHHQQPALLERLAQWGLEHQEVQGRLYTRDPNGLTLEFLFS